MSTNQSTILILEDDSMMADTLASMVELIGYDTIVFHRSQDALDGLAKTKANLLLLDLNLPDLSGLEVCRRVKDDPELKTIPVIVVSAESNPFSIRRATELGAAQYLIKPVGLDDLETAILQTLSEQTATQ
ncbi:MAG: response regulator [Anaerolineae bacterium]|nr:response regulator [Anaerolineae bacterium]